jgi:succinate dehydrogenase / fumarate reductase flavoprotein subunit
MSESLRNDGWRCQRKGGLPAPPNQIAEGDRDYYLERKYPLAFSLPR